MNTENTGAAESVNMTDIFGLASWSRERSDDELRSFVAEHHDKLASVDLTI